jgi:hypothetical protein
VDFSNRIESSSLPLSSMQAGLSISRIGTMHKLASYKCESPVRSCDIPQARRQYGLSDGSKRQNTSSICGATRCSVCRPELERIHFDSCAHCLPAVIDIKPTRHRNDLHATEPRPTTAEAMLGCRLTHATDSSYLVKTMLYPGPKGILRLDAWQQVQIYVIYNGCLENEYM